jgi:hypothetical protein
MSGKRDLSISQQLAIENITQNARTRKCEAQKTIKEVLQLSDIPRSTFEDTVLKVFKREARAAFSS